MREFHRAAREPWTRALGARAPLWVATLALVLTAAPWATVADAAPPETEGTSEEIEAARAEVRAGSAAFQAGDFAVAIEHYEAAMALRPAPKLHYNIGVCHQRLSLAAQTPEDRTRRRDLAIESYNAYLEQNPRAEDRLEVAETIRELGGTPVTMPGLKPLFEDEGGDQAPPDTTPDTTPDPPPDTTAPDPPPDTPIEPPPAPNHGRFGVALVGGFSPSLSSAAAVDAPGLLAFDIHAGGFVGPRRRFLLAAHTALFSGAVLRTDGLAFYGYSIGLVGMQTWVLGRKGGEPGASDGGTLQLGFGALAALTGQGISERQDVPPPLCSLERDSGQVASRSGGLLAPRFDLGILMGPRRRAMISALVQPSLAMFGNGPSGAACQADETPWTVLGIRRRWQFQLWVGLGFGFRF